jgi:chorismate dehydratase
MPRVFGSFAEQGKVHAGPMSLQDFEKLNEDSSKWEMLPHGIAVKGKVMSVLLYSHHEWANLEGKKIGITAETSTSVELLRVLLEKKYGVKNFTFERLHPTSFRNDYTKFDAVLLIGDEALRRVALGGLSTFLNVYDLAEEWTEWKNLPFVFAVWAMRSDLPEDHKKNIRKSLESSLKQSVGRNAEIGREHGKKLGLTSEAIGKYLDAFRFEFGDEEMQAIAEFERELAELQVVA